MTGGSLLRVAHHRHLRQHPEQQPGFGGRGFLILSGQLHQITGVLLNPGHALAVNRQIGVKSQAKGRNGDQQQQQ